MSETTPAPAAGTTTPSLVVNIQYVKDMSFEVPGAPAIYSQLRTAPHVNINLDVQARRIAQNQDAYEVSIVIRAEAHEQNPAAAAQANGQAASGSPVPATVFVAELTYAGVFTVKGIPEAQTEAALPDWSETLVVSHWGFILTMTGKSVMNGTWLRCDPTEAAPDQLVWRP